MKNKMSQHVFLFAKEGPSSDDLGVGARGTPYFRRYGRELVSKPAISLKKRWGGYRRTTLTGTIEGPLLCS